MGLLGEADGQRVLTRSELEIELGKLALVLERARPRGRATSGGMPTWPQPVIDGFLDACVRLLAQTRSAHRAWAIDRLCRLAVSAQLGIIGLPEWLGENAAPGITSDTLRVRPAAAARAQAAAPDAR